MILASWTRSGTKPRLEADLGWSLSVGWHCIGEAAYLVSGNHYKMTIQYWEVNPIPDIMAMLPDMWIAIVESNGTRMTYGPLADRNRLVLQLEAMSQSSNFVSAEIVPIKANRCTETIKF